MRKKMGNRMLMAGVLFLSLSVVSSVLVVRGILPVSNGRALAAVCVFNMVYFLVAGILRKKHLPEHSLCVRGNTLAEIIKGKECILNLSDVTEALIAGERTGIYLQMDEDTHFIGVEDFETEDREILWQGIRQGVREECAVYESRTEAWQRKNDESMLPFVLSALSFSLPGIFALLS